MGKGFHKRMEGIQGTSEVQAAHRFGGGFGTGEGVPIHIVWLMIPSAIEFGLFRGHEV